MSYPVRYSAAGTKIVETDPAGPLVEYIDYAILKAEVERLRKAGDNLKRAMLENGCHSNGDFEDQQNAVQAWLAAKEGKSQP